LSTSTQVSLTKKEELELEREMSMAYWGANEVLPGIFLGGARDARNLEAMKQRGVTHILNVADDVQNFHPDHFTYLRLEVRDYGMDQGISRVFDKGLEFVREAVRDNGKVLVHCMAGINRSATMSIYCVMNFNGWSLKRAYAHVYSCRNMIDPMLDNQKELIRFAIKVNGEQAEIPDGWSLNRSENYKKWF